jgi:hypothetical protein
MKFQTIATFEKTHSNVLELLVSDNNYKELLKCYLYDGNPYSIANHKLTEDNSYLEVCVTYHGEEFYRMWYDEFKDTFIPLHKLAFDSFKEQGININHFFSAIDLPGLPEDRQPLESFVSRFQ